MSYQKNCVEKKVSGTESRNLASSIPLVGRGVQPGFRYSRKRVFSLFPKSMVSANPILQSDNCLIVTCYHAINCKLIWNQTKQLTVLQSHYVLFYPNLNYMYCFICLKWNLIGPLLTTRLTHKPYPAKSLLKHFSERFLSIHVYHGTAAWNLRRACFYRHGQNMPRAKN